jgi:hypothetical protein
MDELPGPIRQRVVVHVNGAVIDSVPFFALCDDTAKQLIVSILKPEVFLPTDTIAQQGEVGTEMYLIERGQVLVSSQDGTIRYATVLWARAITMARAASLGPPSASRRSLLLPTAIASFLARMITTILCRPIYLR